MPTREPLDLRCFMMQQFGLEHYGQLPWKAPALFLLVCTVEWAGGVPRHDGYFSVAPQFRLLNDEYFIPSTLVFLEIADAISTP